MTPYLKAIQGGGLPSSEILAIEKADPQFLVGPQSLLTLFQLFSDVPKASDIPQMRASASSRSL